MKNSRPLTFCFFLQVLILMISIVTTHCRRILESNDETLIENTCKKTPNYNLCLQYLKSDPGSSSADVPGLGLIMVKVMKTKATDTLKKIHQQEIGARGKQKEALSSCASNYNTILIADVPQATQALEFGNPKYAEDAGNDAAIEATSCESGFPQKSPITQENNVMRNVAIILAAIARQLL